MSTQAEISKGYGSTPIEQDAGPEDKQVERSAQGVARMCTGCKTPSGRKGAP